MPRALIPARPLRRRSARGVSLLVAIVGIAVISAACRPLVPKPTPALPPPPAPHAPAPAPTTTTTVTLPPPKPGGAIPTGLPTHFAIGVSAQPPDLAPSGWEAQSGVPFDYAYQYLAAGVNTGAGWQTWNTNAQFPLWYARDAHTRGAVPVFPYYMLLQSTGTCDTCGEAQRDLANLNDNALMAAYYADFAKLMQRLGPGTYDGVSGFGGTAIVHVEPDLSGYAQQAVLHSSLCYSHCTGTGNDPSLLRASVASSGFAAASTYPDTYRGFNLALLHLRDLYAPNVKLAFHVSNWSTGRDIGSDTDSTLDPVAQGNLVGAFAAASGVSSAPAGTSTYDLVFNDVADRDAGYYKYVRSQPNAFWDRLNVTLPTFTRWERFLGAITATTGRRAIVWQVPLGNQYFKSENNSDGHYQDNRAEYFFGHPQELIDVGVIAVLYGRGNGGSTINTDDKSDGITNPTPFCSTDGTSSGSVCNTNTATVADDDGGYLRMAGAAYYAATISLH